MKEIERFFRPEFINRLDDVIVFHPLTRDDLVEIVEYEVEKVREAPEARALSARARPGQGLPDREGYNPDFGARPLRRAIGTYIEDPLSEMLLAGG
jgi:ATP-dependent Clp protease ATP-binding subunit ClpC